jgi:Cu-processing system ATP-binding protein
VFNTRVIKGQGADGFMVELACDNDAKMEVVRRAVAFGPAVCDIEIAPPTLDELYARFLNGEPAG